MVKQAIENGYTEILIQATDELKEPVTKEMLEKAYQSGSPCTIKLLIKKALKQDTLANDLDLVAMLKALSTMRGIVAYTHLHLT